MSPADLAKAFIAACDDELRALKPGNVHIHSAGHGMEVRHFEASALAAAPHIACRGLRVGRRIERAVAASFEAAGCNTNLGIVLLTAPLAAAAEETGGSLRDRLRRVLSRLGPSDANDVFAAITRANPGGLGRVETGDVSGPALISLREAMGLAAGRDRIARAYIEDFKDIFEFGLPELAKAWSATVDPQDATTALHMAYLAAFPDSHILRKFGMAAAEKVQKTAQLHRDAARPPISSAARAQLLEFDKDLKSQSLNPGTTADFVVATLFAARIISPGPRPPGR